MKLVWQWITRSVFRFMLAATKVVPYPVSVFIARGVGRFAFLISPRYRNVAQRNLLLAFGDSLSEGKRNTIIVKVFENFIRTLLVEFMRCPSLSPQKISDLFGGYSLECVDELMKHGKGAIIVSAHLGNWEMLARSFAVRGYKGLVVVRNGPDKKLNALTDELRRRSGYVVHPRGASPKHLLNHLRSNNVVVILPDQKSDDLFVPFFGVDTGTTAGPAILSLKTGCPIVTVFAPRLPNGKYKMVFGRIIWPDPLVEKKTEVLRIMTEINAEVEAVIRDYPDQWLWLHDRWRVRRTEPIQDSSIAVVS